MGMELRGVVWKYEYMKRSENRRFIHISTTFWYGNYNELPDDITEKEYRVEAGRYFYCHRITEIDESILTKQFTDVMYKLCMANRTQYYYHITKIYTDRGEFDKAKKYKSIHYNMTNEEENAIRFKIENAMNKVFDDESEKVYKYEPKIKKKQKKVKRISIIKENNIDLDSMINIAF